MRFSNKYKFIYFANPKSGSTSIRDFFDKFDEEIVDNYNDINQKKIYHDHWNAQIYYEIFKNHYNIDLKTYFSFTIIRNPWDKIVSAFKYQKRDKNGIEWYTENYDQNTAGEYSFENMLRNNINNEKNWNGCGVLSADNFCYDETNTNCLITKIYKLETFSLKQLENDMNEFYKNNNLDITISFHKKELDKLNCSEQRINYKTFYTENWMIETIKKYYFEDIKIGNYIFSTQFYRIGVTESSLLFNYWVMNNNIALNETQQNELNILKKNKANYFYTTSGYYDKTINGSYMNFNVTYNEQQYNKFFNLLLTEIQNSKKSILCPYFTFQRSLFELKNEFIKFLGINGSEIILHENFWDMDMGTFYDSTNNKKVLIISSFAELMKEQYESGNVNKINSQFPKFKTISAYNMIYTYFNNGPHNNLFETADFIFDKINDIDFDIAIVSCGAYSLVLGNLIKTKLNKDVITFGNALSVMFGIIGKRSKKNYDGTNHNNNYYITNIPDSYKPDGYEKIEGGCYW
jgi:hypothetical protein